MTEKMSIMNEVPVESSTQITESLQEPSIKPSSSLKVDRSISESEEGFKKSLTIPHGNQGSFELEIENLAEDELEDESSSDIHEVFSSASHETLQFKSHVYRFPILRDPGLDEAFAFREDPPKIYEEDGQELFKDKMRDYNLTLTQSFYRGLKKKKIDLQFSRLDPRAMLPMSMALIKNTTVTEINLRGNHLTTDAAFHLAEVLVKNKVISTLNLSGCRLGKEGICQLGDALELSTSLQHLDLSKNELGDLGLECLVNGIGYNTSIKYLNLSHNKLTPLAAPHLTDIFVINSAVTTLDISWNDINQESALRKMLFSISKLNETLEHLIMQWNGLSGDNTASYFKTFLNKHKAILGLDLSYNRFQGNGAMETFSKGINSSESLVTFNLSYNPLTIDNVSKLVFGIAPNSSLKHLKLVDLWIRREDFDVAQSRGNLFIEIEGTRGIKKDSVNEVEIQKLLLKRCHYLGLKPKKKSKKREFGHFLLRMEEEGKLKPIKKSKFEELVGNEGLLMEPGMLVELMKWFKGEKNRVDLVLMLKMYKGLFPDVALPPKKKKGATDRVSLDAEALMKIKEDVISSILDELISAATIGKPAATLEELMLKIELAKDQGASQDEIKVLLKEAQAMQAMDLKNKGKTGEIEGKGDTSASTDDKNKEPKKEPRKSKVSISKTTTNFDEDTKETKLETRSSKSSISKLPVAVDDDTKENKSEGRKSKVSISKVPVNFDDNQEGVENEPRKSKMSTSGPKEEEIRRSQGSILKKSTGSIKKRNSVTNAT